MLGCQGKWLFYKDQKADEIYLVKKGAVELLIKVEDTIEIPIAIIRPDKGLRVFNTFFLSLTLNL